VETDKKGATSEFMRSNGRTIIDTDLDGTFLDEEDYSFRESLPALRAAEERGIPVVFCSSKTRAEIEHLRKAAKVTDPFIVENGGAIFVPEGYFPITTEESMSRDTTIGIGDGLNDVPMLSKVATPIIVKLTSGAHQPELVAQFPQARLTKGIGPRGWAEAVMQLVREKA
jgi:predicted mannosyl-3-phosphoglycerate phosphatase (HAD superfamily)